MQGQQRRGNVPPAVTPHVPASILSSKGHSKFRLHGNPESPPAFVNHSSANKPPEARRQHARGYRVAAQPPTWHPTNPLGLLGAPSHRAGGKPTPSHPPTQGQAAQPRASHSPLTALSPAGRTKQSFLRQTPGTLPATPARRSPWPPAPHRHGTDTLCQPRAAKPAPPQHARRGPPQPVPAPAPVAAQPPHMRHPQPSHPAPLPGHPQPHGGTGKAAPPARQPTAAPIPIPIPTPARVPTRPGRAPRAPGTARRTQPRRSRDGAGPVPSRAPHRRRSGPARLPRAVPLVPAGCAAPAAPSESLQPSTGGAVPSRAVPPLSAPARPTPCPSVRGRPEPPRAAPARPRRRYGENGPPSPRPTPRVGANPTGAPAPTGLRFRAGTDPLGRRFCPAAPGAAGRGRGRGGRTRLSSAGGQPRAFPRTAQPSPPARGGGPRALLPPAWPWALGATSPGAASSPSSLGHPRQPRVQGQGCCHPSERLSGGTASQRGLAREGQGCPSSPPPCS